MIHRVALRDQAMNALWMPIMCVEADTGPGLTIHAGHHVTLERR